MRYDWVNEIVELNYVELILKKNIVHNWPDWHWTLTEIVRVIPEYKKCSIIYQTEKILYIAVNDNSPIINLKPNVLWVINSEQKITRSVSSDLKENWSIIYIINLSTLPIPARQANKVGYLFEFYHILRFYVIGWGLIDFVMFYQIGSSPRHTTIGSSLQWTSNSAIMASYCFSVRCSSRL